MLLLLYGRAVVSDQSFTRTRLVVDYYERGSGKKKKKKWQTKNRANRIKSVLKKKKKATRRNVERNYKYLRAHKVNGKVSVEIIMKNHRAMLRIFETFKLLSYRI